MKKLLCLLGATLLCLYSYAQIEASVLEGCAPLNSVDFSTSYNNPTNIIWDFGDDSGSNLPAPSHTFVNPGSYTVTFTATVNGQEVQDSLTINVYDNPTADFSIDGSCLETAFEFTDNSIGTNGSVIADWEWTFGDGGSQNGVQNPSYSYNQTGLYDVGLIVTDENGCTDALIINDVAVSESPNLNVITNPSQTSACDPPLTIEFSANASSNSPLGNGLTYSWDFGNGNVSDLPNPPSQTYDDFGTWNYTLTVTDEQGCSSTDGGVVSIDSPIAEFTIEGAEDGVVCSLIDINNLTDFNPFFDYGDGQVGSDTLHSYNEAGEYQVIMTIGQAGCFDSDTVIIEVEIPEFELLADPTLLCSIPGEIDLSLVGNAQIDMVTWTPLSPFVEDIIDNGQTGIANIFYEELEEFQINGELPLTYSATIVTENGCETTVQRTDTLWQPNALFFADVTEGCA
ncbi:MAG: PKD domain-containing protein, partial [Bacteroidota bacterium]